MVGSTEIVRTRWLSWLVLTGVGLVWLGQGIGWIPGSFMTGSVFWAIIGAIAVIVGIVLMVLDRSRK
jgi:hypothetical protein